MLVHFRKENFMKTKKLYKSNDDVSSVESLTVCVDDAAKMIGVCPRTVRKLTQSGDLPVIRIGNRVLYSRADLIKFVQQSSVRAVRGQGEQVGFTPSTVYPTLFNPIEWVIQRHEFESDIIRWNNPMLTVGRGR